LADIPDRLRDAIAAHYNRVRSRFVFLVGDNATADDLVQEVFTRFWESCVVRGVPRDAQAFIGGVERIVFLEHLRSKKRWPTMVEDDVESRPASSDAPLEAASRLEAVRVLQALLGRLEPLEQWLIVGRHFYEMTGRELAELSGMPRRTLMDRYNRAMERLRYMAVQEGLSL